MNKYLEKLKTSSINVALWKIGGRGSANSPELGWCHTKMEEKRRISLSSWMLLALPVVAFLSLAIYFIIVDAEILTSAVDRKDVVTNHSESPWNEVVSRRANATTEYLNSTRDASSEEIAVKEDQTPQEEGGGGGIGDDESGGREAEEDKDSIREEEEEEEDPNLIVRFDYVDLSSEELPRDGQFIESLLTPKNNNSREAIIILKNDDSGKKIFLKGLVGGLVPPEEEDYSTEAAVTEQKETTTAKAFVYSPTIPQASPKKVNVDVTTKKYNQSEDNLCFSTKLDFCEGVLPYDVVQLPNLPGIKRYSDLSAVLPYFQMIIDSGCSLRAREFICPILEPECQPETQKQSLPCKLNCKVVSDDCRDFILETLALSKVFDCRRYPDWDESEDCVNMSKGQCHDEEFQCSDGTCIPLKWVCDGVHDCPGARPSFDESNCQGCSENEFRCVLDGKCVPLHWKCDGQIDCIDHSDELSC